MGNPHQHPQGQPPRRAHLGGFWEKVVTSGGGLVLIIGTVLSLWQNRIAKERSTRHTSRPSYLNVG